MEDFISGIQLRNLVSDLNMIIVAKEIYLISTFVNFPDFLQLNFNLIPLLFKAHNFQAFEFIEAEFTVLHLVCPGEECSCALEECIFCCSWVECSIDVYMI